MLKKYTNAIIEWMIKYEVIQKKEEELYAYAVYSFILFFFPFFLAFGVGICFGKPIHGICIILPFIILRKFSGGYHAENLLKCIITSVFLMFFCMVLSIHINYNWKLALITLISSISLLLFSPVENKNRILSSEEKKLYKKKLVLFLIIIYILIIAFLYYRSYSYAISFSIGIQLVASLQIPCIIKLYLTKKCKKMSF